MNENCNELKWKNKKRLFVFGSMILVIAILVSTVSFILEIRDKSLGMVTNISATKKGADIVELKIKYILPSGGYSVREVSEDEGEYCGDGMTDYDGSLGKYRIMVRFGDVEPSDALLKKFSKAEVIELKSTPIKIKATVAFPEDHGFVLYIGFDEPIGVENVKSGELNQIGGTIKIPIHVNTD